MLYFFVIPPALEKHLLFYINIYLLLYTWWFKTISSKTVTKKPNRRLVECSVRCDCQKLLQSACCLCTLIWQVMVTQWSQQKLSEKYVRVCTVCTMCYSSDMWYPNLGLLLFLWVGIKKNDKANILDDSAKSRSKSLIRVCQG